MNDNIYPPIRVYVAECIHQWVESGEDKLDGYNIVICANCHAKKGLGKDVILFNKEKEQGEKHP